MAAETQPLTSARVRELAVAGHVAKHPTKYHVHEKGFKLEQLVKLLCLTFHVERDRRTDENGKPRHPEGYLAWAQTWTREVFRIDFELQRREPDEVILIVTAMRSEP